MAPLSALHTQIEESNGIYSRCLYGQLLAPQTSFKSNLNAHYGFKQQRKLIELPFFNRTHLHTHTHSQSHFLSHPYSLTLTNTKAFSQATAATDTTLEQIHTHTQKRRRGPKGGVAAELKLQQKEQQRRHIDYTAYFIRQKFCANAN